MHTDAERMARGTQRAMKSVFAILIAVAIALPLVADPGVRAPESNELPKLDKDHGRYIMLLLDSGTPIPGSNGAHTKKMDPPDVAKLGGKVLHSKDTRHIVDLPPGKAKELRNHPAVAYLQRVWMGEPLDELIEDPYSDVKNRPAFETDADLTWSRNYDYDDSGNITAIGSDNYTYDTAGRLIQATVGGKTETYQYDSFGNLVGKTLSGVSSPTPVNEASNRLLDGSYDAAGNLVARGSQGPYVYDSFNMLERTGGYRMIYDALDERVGVSYGGNTRWTIRDLDNRVLREFTGGTSPWTWEQDYIYVGDRLTAGEQISWQIPNTNGTPIVYGGTRHYHLDHLGSVRVVTDGNGKGISAHEYYPYGVTPTQKIQDQINSADVHVDTKRFTGHERVFVGLLNIEDSNYLDYMHARYYDPNLGRFLSVDPLLDLKRSIREPQSWNRYSYVVNNPINRIDPDGRMDGNGMGEPVEWRCPGCTRAEALEQSNQIAAGTAKGAAVTLSLMAGGAGVYAFATNAAFRVSVLMNLTGIGIGMTAGVSVPVFRGGQSMAARLKDVKIVDGLVQPLRGVSLNAVAKNVESFGGAYRVKSIPDGLQIIQVGPNPNKYEIVPKAAMKMEEFQKLLGQVQLEAVK